MGTSPRAGSSTPGWPAKDQRLASASLSLRVILRQPSQPEPVAIASGSKPGSHPGPAPSELARSQNPHVILFPYSAMIYVDRSWLAGLGLDKYRRKSSRSPSGPPRWVGGVAHPIREFHRPTGGCGTLRFPGRQSGSRNCANGWEAKPDFCAPCWAGYGNSKARPIERRCGLLARCW